MKWLIHLYPKKWRKRYEEEFLYILENRNLSFKEVVDVFINAMDARFLNIVEGVIHLDKKIRDMTLDSVLSRLLIIGSIIFIGTFGGYWIGANTALLLELSPKALLLVGVGLGLFIGYVIGVARGILRVINVTQKEDIFLPTGKLKFDKSNS
ncbi:hypothetical protein [Radiobacillus deserti]|uniref:Uncharacterized protein n=1 Tax=Radiobacillus deserti TaxID=2594883 RepID=A0A516KJD9_9BACI|nr:hypothetical protein [Radiobacillus deserti]QDP41517.1 hypothetical protein FN924_15860 [Radiobacillus deserti]